MELYKLVYSCSILLCLINVISGQGTNPNDTRNGTEQQGRLLNLKLNLGSGNKKHGEQGGSNKQEDQGSNNKQEEQESNNKQEEQGENDRGRTTSTMEDTGNKVSADKPEPRGPQLDYQQIGVDYHNEYREDHGVPGLVGNKELHDAAVKCAEYYLQINEIDHTCPYKKTANFKTMGENIWYVAGWKDPYSFVAKTAIQGWYGEIKNYNFQEPAPKKFLYRIGHFTQLVWKGSRHMGFGISERNARWKGMVVVALYYPPGNVQGAFKANVPPAVRGKMVGHPG